MNDQGIQLTQAVKFLDVALDLCVGKLKRVGVGYCEALRFRSEVLDTKLCQSRCKTRRLSLRGVVTEQVLRVCDYSLCLCSSVGACVRPCIPTTI